MGKNSHKRRLEQQLEQNNTRDVWRGLRWRERGSNTAETRSGQILSMTFFGVMSLTLETVPVLWQPSCVVPGPKSVHPK